MDEQNGTQALGAPLVNDENQWYVLASTDDGWGIWEKGNVSGEPVARFSLDDEGYERATDYFDRVTRMARRQRGAWQDRLRLSALITGCIWIALEAFDEIRFAFRGAHFVSPTERELVAWAQAVEGIAYAVFFFSSAAFILLWLHRRSS